MVYEFEYKGQEQATR